MRACFLGQNICALGYGVAMVRSPRQPEPADAGDAAALPREIPPPERVFESPMARELKRQSLRLA